MIAIFKKIFPGGPALKNKKIVFWRFLMSYIAVLLIPIIIVSIIYTTSYQIVEEEIEHNSSAALEQAKQVIDVRLKELDDLAIQLSWNARIQSFMYVHSPLTIADRYKALEIINDLKANITSNQFITDFYIYFKNSDVIINKQSRYDPFFFYDKIHKYENIPYEQWYNDIISCYNNKTYIPSTPLLFDNHYKESITYVQSLPFNEKTFWLANLVVLINEDQIKTLLHNICNDNRSVSYIITSDNKIVSISDTVNSITPIKYDELSGESGFLPKIIDGHHMVISYTTSSMCNWKYISIVPVDVFMVKANRLRYITINVSLILLVAGILIACLMAYRNYIPVKELVDTIKGRLHMDNSQIHANDYAIIKEFLEQTIDENNNLKDQIPIMRASFLLDLIKGEKRSEDVSGPMELLGINFISPFFVVAIIHIDEIANQLFDQQINEGFKMARTRIFEIISGESCKQIYLYPLELTNAELAVLFNFDSNDPIQNQNDVKEFMKKISKVLREKFGIMITCAIGDLCHGIANISTSYHQAVFALNYRLIKGKNSIISYNEESFSEHGHNYYYPIEIETRLMNAAKAGDLITVDNLLNEIFNQNFAGRHPELSLVQCLMFDMISTVIKTLHEINIEQMDIFGNSYDPLAQLMRCETKDELYHTIKQIYSTLCTYINENKKSHNLRLKNDIIRYLNENFGDKNLCLNMVAEHFNLAPAYLSRFFKEQTGENFMDYLNKIRLQKAMLIMKNHPQLLISQIADAVGYTNSNALIRLFKKYKGITPGQYKDNYSM